MASKGFRRECPVCLGAHDDLIHAATENLHAWWRNSLLSRIEQPEAVAEPVTDD
jgi:hypothetical protein